MFALNLSAILETAYLTQGTLCHLISQLDVIPV
jgi:hypothetical protein